MTTERLTDIEFKVLTELINHPLAFYLDEAKPTVGPTGWALIFKGCAMITGSNGRASLYATAQGAAYQQAEAALREKAAD